MESFFKEKGNFFYTIVRQIGDIVRHKRKRESLLNSQGGIFFLLDSFPTSIHLQAKDYSIPFANRSFRERFGSPEGKKCYEVLAGRKEPCEVCPTFQVFETKRHQEWNMIGPNGRVYEVYDIPFTDGKGSPLLLELSFDITELKRVEEKLRRSERELAIRNRISDIFLTLPDARMYGEVLQVILEALESKHGAFGYLNREGDIVFASFSREIWEQCRIPDKKISFPPQSWGGAWGKALKERRIICSKGPHHVPHGHIPIAGVLVVPILYQGDVIGEVMVANKETDYTKDDQELLETIANSKIAPLLYTRLQKERQEEERKHSEESLKAAYVELDQIFNSAADGMRLVDKNFSTLRVNKTFLTLTGMTEDEVVGKKCYETFPGSSCRTAQCSMARIMSGEERVEYDVEKERRDGTMVPCLVTATPFRSPDGKLIGIIEDFKDITERKRIEEELKRTKEEAEAKYLALVRQAKDGVVIIQDGVWKFVNDAMAEIVGYKPEEMMGRPFWEIVAPECRELLIHRYHLRQSGEDVPSFYEAKFLNKDGSVKDVEISAGIIQYQGKPATLTIFRDITGRKRAEEALRESKIFFSGTLNGMITYVSVLKPNGEVIFINDSPLQSAGIGHEDVLGKMFYDAYWWSYSEEARQRIKSDIEACVSGKTLVHEIEALMRDGQLRWIELSMHPIFDKEGRVKYLVPEGRDITDRKRAEEEKEKIRSQLLQSQKMEAIGILAGGVAHDFNNILTAIQGYTTLAMMKTGSSDPKSRDLDQIRLCVGRAANLTRQLLLFGRKQPTEPVSLDLNETVGNLLKMLHRLIGEDVSIKMDLGRDLWHIFADEGNIEQVIMNLAVNARDAMPEGGKLTIRTENIVLDEGYVKQVSEARSGQFICLSVEDTGVGIDKEVIDHIFEPFFTTKGAGEGTGLGLSVVYGIVKQHEGWITVFSEQGQGTVFKIFLPAFSVKSERKTRETVSLHELRGKGERILLVEDDQEVREVTVRVLREYGYQVIEASNAQEVLDIFERERGNFHLVLSDVVLPDKSGLELADQLLLRCPQVMILLASGYPNQKSQWPIIRQRGFPFIQKPYDLPDLLRVVRNLINSGFEIRIEEVDFSSHGVS